MEEMEPEGGHSRNLSFFFLAIENEAGENEERDMCCTLATRRGSLKTARKRTATRKRVRTMGLERRAAEALA